MLCDRILLINKGVLVEERSMDALKEDLRNYVLIYYGAPPLIGLAAEMSEQEDGTIRAGFTTKQDLVLGIEKIGQSGGHVTDVIAQEGSLEEYFIKRIQEAA